MTEVMPGHATDEGTREFAEWAVKEKGVHPQHFRTFQSLRISSLGVGTYLGEPDAETDRLVEEAVYQSVASGAINIVDTAINYRFQKAERVVGRALKRLISSGIVKRGACIVATKNGYLTHDADLPVDFWTYIHRKLVKPGTLKPEDIAGQVHAMSPSFLRDQFERSLRNLGLECIDLLYLHNAPESWLPEIGLGRFLERLEPAFTFYEEERKRGRLRFYGLATWTCFRVPKGHAEHLNLEEVVKVAKKVGGEQHGFRFIQLPLNIVMPEAVSLKNQALDGEPLTTFEAAERLGLGVFTSAPLAHGRLAHHPQVPPLGGTQSRPLFLMQFARSSHRAVLAPLVGHKQPNHMEENLKLASLPPLTSEEFSRIYAPFIRAQGN